MKLRPSMDELGRPVSFATLMALERVSDVEFKSTTMAFQPGGPMSDANDRPRAYGGHVYSQAVWAAAQTVGEGFLLSSVSGFFILMGLVEVPFTYRIKKLRDGKAYCTRAVEVMQDSDDVIFTCTCNFKKADWDPIEFQERVNIAEKYKAVLAGKRPQDHPAALSLESRWFTNSPKAMKVAHPLPGLRTRKVDMKAYNDHRPPLERRRLLFYSVIGAMPPVKSSPNLHACAHLYASDRNSLTMVTEHLNVEDNKHLAASLNHTVIFHATAESLSMTPAADQTRRGEDKWFVQEAWTDRLGDGRGAHHSKLWDPQGRHIATTIQDGLIRLKFESEEEKARVRQQLESGRAKI